MLQRRQFHHVTSHPLYQPRGHKSLYQKNYHEKRRTRNRKESPSKLLRQSFFFVNRKLWYPRPILMQREKSKHITMKILKKRNASWLSDTAYQKKANHFRHYEPLPYKQQKASTYVYQKNNARISLGINNKLATCKKTSSWSRSHIFSSSAYCW